MENVSWKVQYPKVKSNRFNSRSGVAEKWIKLNKKINSNYPILRTEKKRLKENEQDLKNLRHSKQANTF